MQRWSVASAPSRSAARRRASQARSCSPRRWKDLGPCALHFDRVGLGDRVELGGGAVDVAIGQRNPSEQQAHAVCLELVAILAEQRDRAGRMSVVDSIRSTNTSRGCA
jgi:hypothetical protein